MGKLKKKIDWDALRAEAEQRILQQAVEQLPGEEKMERVLDTLVKWADEQIQFEGKLAAIGEVVSDAALRLILKPLIRGMAQDAFDALRARAMV